MSLNDLLSSLRQLDLGDKLRVMHFLISEIAREEQVELQAGSYPIWSPYNADDAASVLLRALNAKE